MDSSVTGISGRFFLGISYRGSGISRTMLLVICVITFSENERHWVAVSCCVLRCVHARTHACTYTHSRSVVLSPGHPPVCRRLSAGLEYFEPRRRPLRRRWTTHILLYYCALLFVVVTAKMRAQIYTACNYFSYNI